MKVLAQYRGLSLVLISQDFFIEFVLDEVKHRVGLCDAQIGHAMIAGDPVMRSVAIVEVIPPTVHTFVMNRFQELKTAVDRGEIAWVLDQMEEVEQ